MYGSPGACWYSLLFLPIFIYMVLSSCVPGHFFFLKKYLFIYLVLVVAHGIFSLHCSTHTHYSCVMWDLVPWSGIKPGPSALGVCSLNHWATREVLPGLSWLCVRYCAWWLICRNNMGPKVMLFSPGKDRLPFTSARHLGSHQSGVGDWDYSELSCSCREGLSAACGPFP